MARNPINRAITNVAAEMRKNSRGFYYVIPKSYLSMINKEDIARRAAQGVPLKTAAREAIAKVSEFVLPKNMYRDKPIVVSGKEGLEATRVIDKYNRSLDLLEGRFKRQGQEMPEGRLYKTDYGQIMNLQKVTDYAKQARPAEKLKEWDEIARNNLEKSLDAANVPARVVQDIMRQINTKYKGIGDFNNLLKNRDTPIAELYGSDTQDMKLNIRQFMTEIGLNPADYPELNQYTAFTKY